MLTQGFASHRKLTGREPDAVVFSSFLWDMQRWGRFFPGKVLERGLSTETIQEWSADLIAVLALIKVRQWALMSCRMCKAYVLLLMVLLGL